ncbi:juvenile hormone acid O-methyltransferase-like [Diabrotica virgifera virgifera]|uniref:Juvenile hormone acid O-methyltransferase-like n=1 Tax=Diabrotica virgifera virgifera TaxID=50390 RepID=A0A6P7GP95_DIAVI|nr:juvenile hormone acid O-methyltransferase-like [Diabrotica virgifera virgifera]
MHLPKQWSRSSKRILEITNEHLQKYAHLLKWRNNASILECGIATGENSLKSIIPILPQDYKEYVATDKSQIMLQYAKNIIKIPRSIVCQLDVNVRHPPLNMEDRFDHIFGFFLIHMTDNPRQAFRNFHRMLKPGGSLFLNFYERLPVDMMFHNLRSHPKWGKYHQEDAVSVYYYTQNPKEEYRKDIEAAGFKNYVYNNENHRHVFKSEDEFRDLYTSVNPILHNIPKEEYDEYIEDYITQYTPNFVITYEDGERTISTDYKMFVFHATKTI